MTGDPKRWERTGLTKLTAKFGHRACFIWLMSAAWIINGIIVAVADMPPTEHLFHTFLPTYVRASIWLIPSVIAAVVARTDIEWLAFVVLGMPPAQRLASYWLGSTIVWTEEERASLGWELFGRGFIWFVVLVLMWLVATWPNPVKIELMEDLNDESGG